MPVLRIAPACYDYTVGAMPRFREGEDSLIIEEILSRKPSEKKVKSHVEKRFKKNK